MGSWAVFVPGASLQGAGLHDVCVPSRRLLADVAIHAVDEHSELWGPPQSPGGAALLQHLDAIYRRAASSGCVIGYFPRNVITTTAGESSAALPTGFQRRAGCTLPLSVELIGHSPLPRALVFCTGLLDVAHSRIYGIITRSEGAQVPADILLGNAAGATPLTACDGWRPEHWALQFALSGAELADPRSRAWPALHASVWASVPQSVLSALMAGPAAPGEAHAGDGSLSPHGDGAPSPVSGHQQQQHLLRLRSSSSSPSSSSAAASGGGGGGRRPAPVEPLPRVHQPPPPVFHSDPRELCYDSTLPLVPVTGELLGRGGEELLRGAMPGVLRSATRQHVGIRLAAALKWALERAPCDPRALVPGYDATTGRVALLLPLPLETAHGAPGSLTSPHPAVHLAAAAYLSDDSGGCYEVRRLLPLHAAYQAARMLGIVRAPWLRGLEVGAPLVLSIPSPDGRYRLCVPNAALGPLAPCIGGPPPGAQLTQQPAQQQAHLQQQQVLSAGALPFDQALVIPPPGGSGLDAFSPRQQQQQQFAHAHAQTPHQHPQQQQQQQQPHGPTAGAPATVRSHLTSNDGPAARNPNRTSRGSVGSGSGARPSPTYLSDASEAQSWHNNGPATSPATLNSPALTVTGPGSALTPRSGWPPHPQSQQHQHQYQQQHQQQQQQGGETARSARDELGGDGEAAGIAGRFSPSWRQRAAIKQQDLSYAAAPPAFEQLQQHQYYQLTGGHFPASSSSHTPSSTASSSPLFKSQSAPHASSSSSSSPSPVFKSQSAQHAFATGPPGPSEGTAYGSLHHITGGNSSSVVEDQQVFTRQTGGPFHHPVSPIGGLTPHLPTSAPSSASASKVPSSSVNTGQGPRGPYPQHSHQQHIQHQHQYQYQQRPSGEDARGATQHSHRPQHQQQQSQEGQDRLQQWVGQHTQQSQEGQHRQWSHGSAPSVPPGRVQHPTADPIAADVTAWRPAISRGGQQPNAPAGSVASRADTILWGEGAPSANGATGPPGRGWLGLM